MHYIDKNTVEEQKARKLEKQVVVGVCVRQTREMNFNDRSTSDDRYLSLNLTTLEWPFQANPKMSEHIYKTQAY